MKNFLQTARERLDKSRKQMAKEIGVSVQTIFRWETGAIIPPVNRLNMIANTYQISMSTLHREVLKLTKGDQFTGDELIINILMSLEADATHTDGSFVIHSFSTRPFLTGANLDIALWVTKCAAVGVEIVYFCLPSSLSKNNFLRMNPDKTKDALQYQIKRSIEYCASIGKPLKIAEINKHLWAITPKDNTDLPDFVRIYGNLIKPLTIMYTTRNEIQPSAQVDKNWKQIIPEHFSLTDIWININEESDSESDVPKWLQISATHWHHQEYYEVVSEIRGSERYKLSLLMED